MDRPIIIVNPHSGVARAERALAMLARHPLPQGRPEILRTEYAGHAAEIARCLPPSCPLVVILGGDGTINQVVTGLMEGMGTARDLPPIGLIPTGTANCLAYELGIPADADGAANVILRGKTRRIDLGVASLRTAPPQGQERPRTCTRYFLCMAGVGFDAEVARSHHAVRGRKTRQLHYFLHMLAGIGSFRFPRIHVEVDGERFTESASSVIVSNVRRYPLGLAVATRARVDDGLLDACVFTGRTFRDMVLTILNVFLGRHIGRRGVAYRAGRYISMSSDDPVPVQLDGDFTGYLPLELRIRPLHVSFFVP